jgi:hypothetical protein
MQMIGQDNDCVDSEMVRAANGAKRIAQMSNVISQCS